MKWSKSAKGAMEGTTTPNYELSASLRRKTASLLECACGEERRTASLELREVVTRLKKIGRTEDVWKEAKFVNDLLQNQSSSLLTEEKAFHRQLGGLLALSTLAISLGQNEIKRDPNLFLDPIIKLCKSDIQTSSLSSARAKVRYHAGEALFNVIKTIRTGIMVHLDDLLRTLTDLAAACDLNIKMAAVMVDKLLKELVLELEQDLSMLDLPSLIPLLSQTLEPPSRTRLPAKDHKRPSDSPRKSRSVSVPSSSSSSPSSRVTSHSPPPTTRFDWGNDRHCVQFLLLSWLDLIVPQTAQPSPEGVCLGKIIKFLSLQTGGVPNYPNLNPVFSDITLILLRVILDDEDDEEEEEEEEGRAKKEKRKKKSNRDSSLRPSKMATILLIRLVSLH